MLNPFKKTPITDFELRNDAARSAYNIREAKKEITKSIVMITTGLAFAGTAAYILVKKLENDLPLED